MQVIGGYCLINDCPDKYNSYVLPYLENPILKLEEMKIQGIYQEVEELTENGIDYLIDFNNLNKYIISNFNQKNKRLIR
jgi:hypothetical protein